MSAAASSRRLQTTRLIHIVTIQCLRRLGKTHWNLRKERFLGCASAILHEMLLSFARPIHSRGLRMFSIFRVPPLKSFLPPQGVNRLQAKKNRSTHRV